MLAVTQPSDVSNGCCIKTLVKTIVVLKSYFIYNIMKKEKKKNMFIYVLNAVWSMLKT